jgi:hypothetical protein
MVGRCLLVGGILLLVSLLFVGCGVPQEDYDAVVAERDSAQAELQSVKTELSASQAKVSELTSSVEKQAAELETINAELVHIKEVYPPRHFNTVKELQDWLNENDASERPASTTVEAAYSKALEIQQDALEDGFIVSAWIDYYFDEGTFYVNCTAVAGGVVWMWSPDTDELTNFSDMTGMLNLS